MTQWIDTVKAAIDRGFDESKVSHLEDPEHSGLPERQQIVLRLANAFLKAPTSFSAENRAVLERHYTPEQIAELLLDLVRFRPGSKLTVTRAQVTGNNPPVVDAGPSRRTACMMRSCR